MVDVVILEEVRTEMFKLIMENKGGYNICFYTAYRWLELPCSEHNKWNLKKRYLNNNTYHFTEALSEDDLDKRYIIRKDGKKDVFWFSNDGFKLLCLAVTSPKSKYVMEHFIQCEKDYIRVLEQNVNENKKELEDLRERVKKFDSLLEKLINKNDRLERERDECLNQYLNTNLENVRLRKIEDQITCKEDFALNGTPEYKFLMLLKEIYLQKVPLYVVDAEFVNAKIQKIKKNPEQIICSDSMDNFMDDLLNYKISTLTCYDIKDLNEEFYFYIPSFKSKVKVDASIYHYIEDIYVVNRNNLNDIRAYLKETSLVNSKFKNIYRISYVNIISVVDDKASDLLYDRQKEMQKANK